MFENEPELGYCHALTVDEAVGQMIGYEKQDMRYDEVLDCFVEQAESKFERALDEGAATDKLDTLNTELDNRYRPGPSQFRVLPRRGAGRYAPATPSLRSDGGTGLQQRRPRDPAPLP